MASVWRIAEMGWGVTVFGWLLSPIIGLLLNKILSYLGFDASQKLRDLEIHTIPELKRALREVVEQRMLKEASKESSDVEILNKLATELRSGLYEAEEILDLIDYHQIEKKVIGDGESHDNSWPQWWVQRLYDAVGTGFARCNRSWMGRCRSAALLRWAWQSLCWLGRCVRGALHRSAALLPISCPPSVSLSSVQRIRCWSGSFDFNNCCRSIFVWSANAIEVARSYRNWSYHELGITSYQEDGIPVDSFLRTITTRNLKKRIEKLENIVPEVKKSHLLNQERSSALNHIAKMNSMNRRIIGSIAARKVFGREEERKMITKMLREAPSSSSSKCYSEIGIYGIAGSGKTTLAEYVCEYEKEAKYFSPIMCIHVSETFRVEDIFHDMLEEITNDRHSNITDPKVLKVRLEEQLRDRRFLLLLDDIWDVTDVNNRQGLEELLSPLNVGMSGSKILVTSRRKDAPLVAQRPIPISDLSEKEYFSMFMHYALGDTSVDREYIQIGSEIAKNLHKSPIAAVTVAGQLRTNPDPGFWGTVAKLDLLNQTTGALWWSYQQLHEDVRRCFEYCSIFPRRYELERDKLVHMWIAQGFVKATKANEDIEDVGKSYFRQLQSCSFLQLKSKTWSGEYFTVHDLLHDLAERVAGSDCFKIERGIVGQISHDVRHLYIESYGKTVLPEQIFELKNLRTLILRCFDMVMSKEDLERVFMSLGKLRVVHLELQLLDKSHTILPGCIGQLKHLRYLGIFARFSLRMTLPAEFTKLYHLQVLSVPPHTHLHFSSEEKMSNLINLRSMHTWYGLNIPDVGRLTSLQNEREYEEMQQLKHLTMRYMHTLYGLNFPDVGRLTSLQKLYRFHVRNKRGYEIQQLEHLNKLRGKLYIEGLENVKSKEEALQAKLAGKKHLTQLALRWGHVYESKKRHILSPQRELREGRTYHQSCSPELQAEVLEGLHPPSQITSLYIVEYGGLRYPSWLSGDRVTQQDSRNDPALQNLMFWSCNGSDVPPRIGGFFVRLCTLKIWDCSWNSLPANMDRLTSLEELEIYGCPNIQSLPKLPQSLKKLEIEGCPNMQSLPKLPQSLKKFTLIRSNRSLTEIWERMDIQIGKRLAILMRN